MSIPSHRSSPRRAVTAALLPVTLCVLSFSESSAREPRDILGATHVNGTYSLSEEPYLIEGARRIRELGFNAIKLYLYPPPANNSSERAYSFHSPDWPEMRTPTDVAKSRYFRDVFAMPFRTYILTVFSGGRGEHYWIRGVSDDEAADETRQFRELALHLMVEYRGSRKTFILSHWEGDWAARGSFDGEADATPQALEGMTRWLNARQAGVAEARAEMPDADVRVYHAAEVNRIRDAMEHGRPCVTNAVLPHTNVDLVSYSAWDTQDDPVLLRRALNFIAKHAPDSTEFGDKNVFIGEFGKPENESDREHVERMVRGVVATALEWGAPYAVFWQVYCNEARKRPVRSTGDVRGFWLIRPDGSRGWAASVLSEMLAESEEKDASDGDRNTGRDDARLGGRIRPYERNPRYWQYRGEPVLLLGGSKTDHIFLLDDLESHLDEIASAGGNYVRSTMSQRESLDLKPHLRLDDGKFDLERWNPDYWERFERCLELCEERGIIVQIEVWDRFDYSQKHWLTSPWRPGNNINYTNRETGLAEEYPAPAWRDRHPFFHTIPGTNYYRADYDVIRRFQERFVAKILSYSLEHGNVLYCMNNETSTPPPWGQYWMRFIKARAKERGVSVYVTDMFDDGWKPELSEKLRQAIDSPELYDFIDISQVNSRNFDEAHWKRFAWVVEELRDAPRPLNHVKIYSDGSTPWGSGTPKDGVERFWRNLIGGAASARFHRPGAGIGLNDTAKACIRAARLAERRVKLWNVDPRLDLLSEREEDEAYLAAKPGEAYLLYFTDGGSVELDLTNFPGPFELHWIDVSAGSESAAEVGSGGERVTITAPRRGGHVAALTRRR